MDKKKMMPNQWLISVVLSFLQCFDPVSLVTEMASRHKKTLCHLSGKVLLWNKCWKRPMEDQPTKAHPENRH